MSDEEIRAITREIQLGLDRTSGGKAIYGHGSWLALLPDGRKLSLTRRVDHWFVYPKEGRERIERAVLAMRASE